MPFKDPAQQKAYLQAHFQKHKDRYVQARKENRRGNRDWLNEFKESKPCSDCGIFYPSCCMDFDHLSDKVMGLNKAVKSWSRERLQVEMEKCDLVCANCHRIRTFDRLTPH